MKRTTPLVALCLLLALVASTVQAQSCTATFPSIDFGQISSNASAATTVSGYVKVTCSGFATPVAFVCVGLGYPSGGGTSSTTRVLPGPSGATLPWGVYKDSGVTKPWGSHAEYLANSGNIGLVGGSGSAQIPYYARVPANPGGAPGNYSLTFSTAEAVVSWTALNNGDSGYCSGTPTSTTRFSFTVKATVVGDCQISATNINFGQVGVVTVPVNATGMVSTTCGSGIAYRLSLDAGKGAGATISARKMTRSGGAEMLGYALYIDATRANQWGDGSSGTSTVSGSGNGSAQTSTVYATLPAQASVPNGTYVDTVTATITF